MARIRSVHPGLFTDEAFMLATPFARLLDIALWCECWDDGVFEWKPLTLKVRLFPADSVDVGALLDELESLNIVKRFQSDGRSYGAVRNFCRYQHPRKRNSSKVMPPELRHYVGWSGNGTVPPEDGGHSGTVPVPNGDGTGTVLVPNRFGTEGREEGEKEEAPLTTSLGTKDIPTYVSATSAREKDKNPDLGLSSSSLATYTKAELNVLKAEFGAVDVAAVVPELLVWAAGKGIPELEQKSAVYGALAQRQAKADLAARQRSPPAEIGVSDALVASLRRRRS